MIKLKDLLNENSDKAKLYSLYAKAMRHMPGSPAQKKIIKQIDALRKKLGIDENQITEGKREYYIDKTVDSLDKYVVKDGEDLYIGNRGMKGTTNFLKFKLAPAKYKSVFNIRLNKGKVKEISKQQLQKTIDKGGVLSYVDFKKLYKR